MYATLLTKDELKLQKSDYDLPFEEIQRAYPDRMRLFSKKEDAEAFAACHPHAFISRSFNYKNADIHGIYEEVNGKKRYRGCFVRKGAERQYDGWLVSMVVPFPKWARQ